MSSSLSPAQLFKLLADETRLRTLLLLQTEGELCVCEIAQALALSQPRISRHLALLRNSALLQDQRQGQWIYYQLNPALEDWVTQLLQISATAQQQILQSDTARLQRMGERPARRANCC